MVKTSRITSMKENIQHERARKMFKYSGLRETLDERALYILGGSSFALSILREEGFTVSKVYPK